MKILYITTIGETMGFFRSFIRVLLKDGHTVDIATNENSGTTAVQEYYREWGCKVYPIPCSRSPLKIGNIKAIKEIRKIVANGNYDIAHCHTPIAAACTRFACRSLRKKNLKVFYTAHGFHFYTGAPIKNWLIYYPVEWLCSWYTDILITINKEDYERAKKRFHAKQIKYVPGVGVDTEKFAPRKSGREATRAELGLKDSDIMLLSVGEMNENKNHISVIRAIKGLSDLVYVIVGKGEKEQELVRAAKENDVDLKLTGFRTDVADVYDAADVYVLPSIREGLNVSLMEAMASGLACCCGNIRGNTDLIEEKAVLFDPLDTDEIKAAISTAIEDRTELGKKNHEKIRSFDLSTIENLTSEIYMGGGMSNLVALLKRQAKRTEIGMPLDAKLLISVGELSVRKNHKVVVEALQELPKNYWYAIVGRGSLKEELENVDHTGRLKLLGFRKDIVDLLHASDVFVFPSLQEGLPVALMEAMAAGLPCIASKIRGNEDLINKSRLVKCDDIEKWIQVIESTVTTIPNEDNCGLENIFKINTVLDKMWEIYRGGGNIS